MEVVISLSGVGIKFRAPRHTRYGNKPRLIGARRQTVWGLREIELDIAGGESLGLIGPNGSGKTTLLRTIAGIYRPDEGEIRVRGRVAPLLSFDGDLKPGISGWENIALSGVLLGLTRRGTRRIAAQIADFSGLGDFLDTEVRAYSTGMKARLGFAVAVYADPDVLVLDEAMMVGDQEFKDRSASVIDRFLDEGRTIIMASHEVSNLINTCNRLALLGSGRLIQVGASSQVAATYVARSSAKTSMAAPDTDEQPPL